MRTYAAFRRALHRDCSDARRRPVAAAVPVDMDQVALPTAVGTVVDLQEAALDLEALAAVPAPCAACLAEVPRTANTP